MRNILWGFCVGSVLATPLLLSAIYVSNAIAEHQRLEYQITQIDITKESDNEIF